MASKNHNDFNVRDVNTDFFSTNLFNFYLLHVKNSHRLILLQSWSKSLKGLVMGASTVIVVVNVLGSRIWDGNLELVKMT